MDIDYILTDTSQTSDGLHCAEKKYQTQALTSCHKNNRTARERKKDDKNKKTECRENTGFSGGTWLSTLPLPWRHDTGWYRRARTHTCTHTYALPVTSEKEHQKWKEGAEEGVLGSLTFQVEFLLQCGNVILFGQTHLSKSGIVS